MKKCAHGNSLVDIPNLIPEGRQLLLILRIEALSFHRNDKHTSLELTTAEHETSLNGGVVTDDGL